MATESSRFYWIDCDHCGNSSNEDDGYLAPSASAARKDVEDKGWQVDHIGKFTCLVCIEEPGWAETMGGKRSE